LKSLQSGIVVFGFVKTIYFLRVFHKLSFLVQMLVDVFSDLRYFLLLFALVIGAFTLVIAIISEDATDGYDGIKSVAFYILALRQSIGDYDTSSFGPNSDYKILAWLLWLVIMVVGNIVFMNFIIAVVSESYENCMNQMIAQSYLAKLEMIIDREATMLDS
jgi:Polycystin cation channel